VNALADEKVGDYLNDHFASAAQKVGTFRIVGEMFRDSDQLIGDGAISMGQALSLAMLIGAAFFAWWAATHRAKHIDATPA